MFPKPGTDTDTGCKDKLSNQGRRSGLWRRLLQVAFLFLLRQQVRSRALQSAYAVGHGILAVEMSGTYGVYSSKQATINH